LNFQKAGAFTQQAVQVFQTGSSEKYQIRVVLDAVLFCSGMADADSPAAKV
jgi:hypothetical protein